MEFAVITNNREKKESIEKTLKTAGLNLGNSPGIVILYGGDGTVLYSERIHPSVPKVPIRGSSTSKTRFYDEKDLPQIISSLVSGKYHVREYSKIQAKISGTQLLALNEVQVHNRHPFEAVRFSITVDNRQVAKDVIGDGVIVSTPFGSAAYYYSLGGTPFSEGMGIAYNNPHTHMRNFLTGSDSVIGITIERGEAYLVRDNDPEMIPLKKGDTVTITKSSEKAQFIEFDDWR